ncbi:uncharacterized protein si:ch211-250c4.3 [Fundulus heteroclitus]|uniref:uncharacterized protein si:ch211-250c4.3 n=1 Tax=Fundulus heteroclitus TaxID=8078 RepID=UPI00165C8C3A|nr:uncharacterized protein si:ch211-250c4.3 [Fundulus heteroclitus]
MSMKRKKAGLVISWQRSFSILAPWRKGKEDRNAVLDSEVVLTKMKLFNNFNEKLLMAEDSVSTVSTASVSDQDTLDPSKASEANSHLEDKPQIESGSEYLPAIFSDSRLSRLYKFESEDSGVELPSGANSPSTPTGSEKSFVVHSRESSCASCNLYSGSTSPNPLVTNSQNSNVTEPKCSEKKLNTTVDTQDNVLTDRKEFDPSAVTVKLYIGEEMDRGEASGFTCEDVREKSEHCDVVISSNVEKSSKSINVAEEPLTARCKDMTGTDVKTESLRRSDTRDSLEDYMDKCCKLSEAQQQRPSPLGSGFGYLEHICQLLEKIGCLQEINLRLQRQICSLQKDSKMTKTKEEFFQQYCSCGASILAFQNWQSKSDLSQGGTFSDLSTIPEVNWHPLMSARKGMSSEDLSAIPEWKRCLNRRSYAEGELHGDDSEGRSPQQARLSDNYMWGRVKDLVRKTKVRNQSRLGLTSTSLKMSCPQLYRPDEEQVENGGRNRNSMIALGHQNKPDLSWL